jgi:hypothetical protein
LIPENKEIVNRAAKLEQEFKKLAVDFQKQMIIFNKYTHSSIGKTSLLQAGSEKPRGEERQ